ncbi:acetylserotonin O-methyltransferase [Candidatus Contubernalis alkaliaceticus]|uniref:acetylserotonin O-methyltransferase n=1 Tax=Candidatus Contubernalis alkaliaceticus TaxID=338645 RepID=UPI001F4C070F|nr:acetylserotonin O-methyltransferase [Candidatus Contubernalis alkalaceticus]UNC93048.1 methyltransferase [Candidatus Contubernalis alkalaceticus]
MENEKLFNSLEAEFHLKFFCEEPYINAEPLYEILENYSSSFKKYHILLTAINIGMFKILIHPTTLTDLTQQLKIDFNFVFKICQGLKMLGLVVEDNGIYQNTEVSNLYLLSDSPFYQGSVFENIQNGLVLWQNLTNTLKNGSVKMREEVFFADNLIHSLAEEALCGEMQRTVSIVTELPQFKKANKLLDLGGGHGLYAIAFSKLNSNLQAYIYDFPNVIEDTKKYIEKYNANRVEVIPGNFFKDSIGNDYDIIFLASNPGGKNSKLVLKIFESLKAGGIFVNKHSFYSKKEESKNILLDIEWNLTAFEGISKGNKVYSFEGDLSYEEYMELLKEHFVVEKVIDAPAFAGYPLSKIGDTLDSKIIIAVKN